MYATMKAAVLRGKEDLRVEQVRLPKAGPGELVVRVDAALTCGTDLKVFRRGYHAKMLTKDRLFGHEVAGTVVEVGEGVAEFKVGERVVPMNSAPCDECFYCEQGQQNLCDDLLFNNGAYAEYMRVPERIVRKNTLRIPEGMRAEHAALTEPLACVLRGLEESGAKVGHSSQQAPSPTNKFVGDPGAGRGPRGHHPSQQAGRGPRGQTAIVLGAGPIGLLFIHAAAIEGLHVIAVVKRTDQVQTARLFGAEQVVRIADVEDPVAAAKALTPGGRGADLVFEAVATPEAWQWAVHMVRKGGVVNWFAGPPAGTEVTLDTNVIHYSDLTLKASFHHTPGTVRQAFEMIASGRFNADAFLTGTASLEDVPQVFERMLTRPAEGTAPEIKTVIYPHRRAEEMKRAGAAELVGERR
ncbi:MAG TPA: alcohol dehydrogenase catalytic domain-containing protein [Acidobacteriaceae bacterium]|nr:alcohol dehydrogenase catalytic domain-containing protein [Acidobacteriaceae bacterium]